MGCCSWLAAIGVDSLDSGMVGLWLICVGRNCWRRAFDRRGVGSHEVISLR